MRGDRGIERRHNIELGEPYAQRPPDPWRTALQEVIGDHAELRRDTSASVQQERSSRTGLCTWPDTGDATTTERRHDNNSDLGHVELRHAGQDEDIGALHDRPRGGLARRHAEARPLG